MFNSYSNSKSYYGGVIINEQHVLTSLICIQIPYEDTIVKPTDIIVKFDFLNDDHVLPVYKIYVSPDYQDASGGNIVILKVRMISCHYFSSSETDG